MKRKQLSIIPIEEMAQDLLDKAYSCEIPKEKLLKMFSDCIQRKWSIEEEKFKKKVEVYLTNNQKHLELYDYGFKYNYVMSDYLKFKSEFNSKQRYKFYLEIICAMYKLHKSVEYGADMTKLYSLLIDKNLEVDVNVYDEVVVVVCMIFEREVSTMVNCTEFLKLREQYQIYDSFQLTILGMLYLVEKENA